MIASEPPNYNPVQPSSIIDCTDSTTVAAQTDMDLASGLHQSG